MSKHIREILSNNQTDINKLLGGPTRLIVAQRKNNSTASLVFAKSSFSKSIVEEAADQECGVGGCLTCKVISLPKEVTLWRNYKLGVVLHDVHQRLIFAMCGYN